MAAAEGFVDAMLASPLGVTLLSVLEVGCDADVGWWRSSPTSTPAAVDAAVDAVASMSFGELIDAAVYTGVIKSGPWISDAPTIVAGAYRHAEARTSIAEAVNDRFGEALHAPLDRAAQQWWTDGSSWFEQLMPLFRKFDRVYGAGQFTWAGLWSVTDPPPEVLAQLAAAWEYEMGPVSRCSLPVRPEARIFEVHRPEDWAQLATEHHRQGKPHPEWELPGINQHHRRVSSLLDVPGQRAVRTAIGRHVVPDWRSVARHYDGVHLSWAGFITAEGCITDLGNGDVTMLRYWFSERTHWLADIFDDPFPAAAPTIDCPAGRRHLPTRPTAPDPVRVLTRLLGR
ncbi:MAG: hypothetical protein LC808_09550 [Actinobacteria bacterium]|nr:hypothetical protein [Actinomycetota bacterium]